MNTRDVAPPLAVSEWIQGTPVSLADLRGSVVVLETFQMLCPGCVAYGLPMAQRLHGLGLPGVVVLGLHTVFEHHDVMGPEALRAFASEYRLTFPIAVDEAGRGDVPVTMERYRLQGTPSTVLIDRQGRIAHSQFGNVDELSLGVAIGRLLAEGDRPVDSSAVASDPSSVCVPGDGCI